MLFERTPCKNLTERFLKSSGPYTDASIKRREKTFMGGWRKVTWLFQKEEISQFGPDIQGHIRVMQIYADALFRYEHSKPFSES